MNDYSPVISNPLPLPTKANLLFPSWLLCPCSDSSGISLLGIYHFQYIYMDFIFLTKTD